MIGICIKYFHENYGGMLQAFATTKVIEKYGLQYELIRYEKKKTPAFVIKSIPRMLNGVLINDKVEAIKKKIGKKKHHEFAANDAIRICAFIRFKEEKFTNLSDVYISYDELCRNAAKYSAVITGSDQLWSPAGLPTNYYNLMFVPDNIRKISYASSFGVKHIPWYQKQRTARFLNRLEFISMRENRGSEIVKELTGRDVPTVLDPVFMFSEAEWAEFIPVKQEMKEPYIFAYFLGSNPEHRRIVTEFAKNGNVKIVTLRHLDQYIDSDETFGDYAPYDVSPERFLNFIRGAEYICTDSFHGSVFSIIHHKKFITFNRYDENSGHSKNSRIDTLCENLGLQDRRFASADKFDSQLKQAIDYNKVQKKLEKLKNDTDEYLKNAFDGIY